MQPQLDFRSEDFCGGETIKLINKLQLLPAIPYNLLKLDYRTIRNAKCLIATAQANFGDAIEGHDDFPPIVEMTVSNKWAKLLHSLVGTKDVKYIIGTRCNMDQEQTFGDKKYATMKYEFAKTIVKKYMELCDDETVHINCDEPNLKSEAVKRAVRRSSELLSRSTYEIYRKNLIWDENKYNESIVKNSLKALKRKSGEKVIVVKSLKRKATPTVVEEEEEEAVSKEVEKVIVLENENENENENGEDYDTVTVENA